MILGVSITEWVGYLASLLLIISFMMKDLKTLRLINSMGAIVFVIYGIMLKTSYPIIITNVFILGVNLFFLFKKKKEVN